MGAVLENIELKVLGFDLYEGSMTSDRNPDSSAWPPPAPEVSDRERGPRNGLGLGQRGIGGYYVI